MSDNYYEGIDFSQFDDVPNFFADDMLPSLEGFEDFDTTGELTASNHNGALDLAATNAGTALLTADPDIPSNDLTTPLEESFVAGDSAGHISTGSDNHASSAAEFLEDLFGPDTLATPAPAANSTPYSGTPPDIRNTNDLFSSSFPQVGAIGTQNPHQYQSSDILGAAQYESGIQSGNLINQQSGTQFGTLNNYESGTQFGGLINYESGTQSGTLNNFEPSTQFGGLTNYEPGIQFGSLTSYESGTQPGNFINQESGTQSGDLINNESGTTDNVDAHDDSGFFEECLASMLAEYDNVDQQAPTGNSGHATGHQHNTPVAAESETQQTPHHSNETRTREHSIDVANNVAHLSPVTSESRLEIGNNANLNALAGTSGTTRDRTGMMLENGYMVSDQDTAPAGRLSNGFKKPVQSPGKSIQSSHQGRYRQSPYAAARIRKSSSRSPPLTALGLDRKTLTAEQFGALDSDKLDGHLEQDRYHPINETDSDSAPRRPIDEENPAPKSVYPAFTNYFETSADAKTHRKRTRVMPKPSTDLERVKKHGRYYWVKRIYEAMIDVSDVVDSESSIHRQRFVESRQCDPMDLEATAHHVFDAVLAVHERGWNRLGIYHKKVVRGKLTDQSGDSVERRLARVCMRLKASKATVDDAMRGGLTLALLVDNPDARGMTKLSNNAGNKKRGERLKLAPKEPSTTKKSRGTKSWVSVDTDEPVPVSVEEGSADEPVLGSVEEGSADEPVPGSVEEDPLWGFGDEVVPGSIEEELLRGFAEDSDE